MDLLRFHIQAKLPIESRCRQSHSIIKAANGSQRIRYRNLGMVFAGPDALSTVDAAVQIDLGLASTDADGLGGTKFDAVGAPSAILRHQLH